MPATETAALDCPLPARRHAAFDAQAHDDWIRAKVAKSLADSRPSIPHEQVMAKVQALIDAKRKQHAGKKAAA